jgi:hypothetical protein
MLPFVFVLAGIGFIQIANAIGQKLSKQKKSPVRVLPGLFVLFLLSLTGVESFIEKEIDPRKYTFVAKCTEAGKWLNRNTTTNTMVASSPIGAVAYYSKRPIIDMLGLADKHIARRILPGVGKGRPGHEKGDGAYVLSRKPDIILMGAVWIDQYPRLIDRVNLGKFLLYTSEKEIWAHPDFKKYYEPVNVLLDSGKYFGFYRLNS